MNPSASARQTVVSVGGGVGLPRAGEKRPGRVRRRWAMMWSTTAWSVMKLKMLPTGHVAARETPREFNRAVLDFVKGVE